MSHPYGPPSGIYPWGSFQPSMVTVTETQVKVPTTTSTPATPPASTTTPKTTTPTSSSTSMATPFAITTTFSAPPACAQSSGGLTILKNRQYQVWLNEPIPVPGTTITSCYPSQFMSSFLAQAGGITQAPFSPLVCPEGYTTQGPYTSNYIACCPSGWDGLAPASSAPSDRPAYHGTCYTNIYNIPLKVTQYDDASIQASSIFTATDSLAQAYAYPYEGFAFGVALVASTTKSSSLTISGSVPSAASSTPSSVPVPVPAQTSSSSPSITPSGGLSGGAIAGIVIGVLSGVALILALVLCACLRYRRRRRRAAVEVPPYEPEMQAAAAGEDRSAALEKRYFFRHGASELDAKAKPLEMPEEPHRWHELESPPPASD